MFKPSPQHNINYLSTWFFTPSLHLIIFLVQDIYFQIWKYHYCNKVIWNCIIISHWKLLHSNIHMLGFAKRYRTLSSLSTISLCFLAWLNYSFFQIFKILSFFRYRRITFSRLDLKRICISQNKRLLKFVMFSLNEHVAPKLLSFLKKELTCSYLLISYYLPTVKYTW